MRLNLKVIAVSAAILIASTAQAQAAGDSIRMASSAPFSSDSRVRSNIKKECYTLGEKLSNFTKSFAAKQGIDIELVSKVGSKRKGRTLQVEIVDAISRGNAFLGHSKYVAIEGSLWENGKKIGSFEGRRSSGGGFMGGYKGSCSVLGRCVKTLGKDIAAWLASDMKDEYIGE